MGFFLETQVRVSKKSRGKRAIGVRATECLLYVINDTELKHISPYFIVIRNTISFLTYNVLKVLVQHSALKTV